MLYNKRIIKSVARILLCTMTAQLIAPLRASALTSGPSQPEVQSFEPVGTTDMVDMFSGDFVYNIPLLDVEGYPVNISYHGGADMEQEASWVGLGWNINPGVINRTVRGLPDDMNGETVSKQINIKDEKNIRVGLGIAGEFCGHDAGLTLGADVSVNLSNYRGVSADIGMNCGVNLLGVVSAGVNLGVGSQSGADVDLYGGLHYGSSQTLGSDVASGVGLNIGTGYSSRTGVKDLTYGLSFSASAKGYGSYSRNFSAVVPIGVKNIVPVITNASSMKMLRGRLKLGLELFGGYGYATANAMFSTLKYEHEGSRAGYGYLYAQNGNNNSIMDFTRDKDGMFNETMKLLPAGNMTYDIYGVSGQGTGGSFRPYRNDFGSVYDPVVSSHGSDFSAEIEGGAGNLIEIGADITKGHTDISSGPWEKYQRPFTRKQSGSIYENIYFKQAGEITETNPGLMSAMQGTAPMDGIATAGIPLKKPGSESMRDPRGNLIYYFTGLEATQYGVASSRMLNSYESKGFPNGSDVPLSVISRVSSGRTESQISEVVQVQTDGRKYIYGIPAMNISQNEVSMAVDAEGPEPDGLVTYTDAQNSTGNSSGRDHFYTKTATPAFAHSYLLSSVLSADYADIKGDGPTDDDFGSFTKFNYTRKNDRYGWKSPYKAGKGQFNAGFKADKQDNKASYISGTKEQWMLHSIETKNFVAEFYVSGRCDGFGVDVARDSSYALDSIRLYNKHDRFINKQAAIPVKTVIFRYSYELCVGVPNNILQLRNVNIPGNQGGKLTLKKIYVRYGNSDKSMLSPYQFSYTANKPYAPQNRDRWGGYKVPDPACPSWDFPYVDQNDLSLDDYASAWSLNQVTLPSGGQIHVDYEADDYAYVMDKPAMEMFKINGLGKSPQFSGSNQLYSDKDNPSLYLYFTRRKSSELPGLSFRDNYLRGSSLLYYSADTRLFNNSYEPIKGYAAVDDVGACADSVHGYIKLAPQPITGGGATLNPISYTGINFGRYYLPHIIFPGADPDNSTFMNIIAGLKYAFGELLGIMKNPVKRMTQEGKAKDIALASSFVRLTSPGMKKKGGGQRVKSIQFFNRWQELAGGNNQPATYGKNYDYTIPSPEGDMISSGVASYEPQIGGDENPFRMPVDYVVQSGGSFPPHDPVGLYQEFPVGESLYPGATVGYSRVTVTSYNQAIGRSSQGEDIYEFYTAKDYPVQAFNTPLNQLANSSNYGFFTQKKVFEGSQGYTLIFNDMHGKPKKTEHRILKPGTNASELVSYKQYNYFGNGNTLSNEVPVIVFDASANKMQKDTRTVGVEADITIDTREKKEEAQSETYYVNVNISLATIIPIIFPPLPPFSNEFNSQNIFHSVVATKVVQQYGILKEVVSSAEGAVTTVRNEAFDPLTGQALVTSVNNEYGDQEYTVNYPAYWGYKSMGPAYQNTGYEETFGQVEVSNYDGILPAYNTFENYQLGDELLVAYNLNGVRCQDNFWVTGFKPVSGAAPVTTSSLPYTFDSLTLADAASFYLSHVISNPNISNCILNSVSSCPGVDYTTMINMPGQCPDCDALRPILHYSRNISKQILVPIIRPRYKYTPSWPAAGTLTNAQIKIVRSGAKNQLNESIQNYTGMGLVLDGSNYLNDRLSKLISISAREYSDTLTAILPQFNPLLNPSGWDSLNIYLNGTRQIKRLSREYVYVKKRDYAGAPARSSGLFDANSFWGPLVGGTGTYAVTNYCKVDPADITQCVGDSIINLMETFTPINGVVVPWMACDPYETLHKLAHRFWVSRTDIYHDLLSDIYNFIQPHPEADPNWTLARTVTKYSPWGFELENKDAIGNYTAAVYGYNQQLPVALAQNARQREILFDGFEDYRLLQPVDNLVSFRPAPYSGSFTPLYLSGNSKYLLSPDGSMLSSEAAHTGKYSLKTPATVTLNFKVKTDYPLQAWYESFTMRYNSKYIVSYWIKAINANTLQTSYPAPAGMTAKSQIIEGWQQMEGMVPATGTTYSFALPGNYYVDDIRIYPMDANMKAFVYHPVNQKLVATLDENNFATFYEYDPEGNLVRTKKETEKGISTIMESRSANVRGGNQ